MEPGPCFPSAPVEAALPLRRIRRGRVSRALAATLCSIGLCAPGCGPAPRPTTAPPEIPPPRLQFVEEEAPFIVDWDAEQMARLTAALRGANIGALVVASRGGVLRLLPDCWVSGVYVPTPIGMYRGMLQVRSRAPAAIKEGVRPDALQQLATSENVSAGTLVDYRVVVAGRYDVSASRRSARPLDLSERAPGACRGATHFIRAALTGAFERASSPDAPADFNPGEVSAVPEKTLLRGGDFTTCLTSGTAQSPACAAFLKIELTRIAAARVELRFVAFTPEGKLVDGVQIVFRDKGSYRVTTPPGTAAAAPASLALPVTDVSEDAPLIVEVVQAAAGGPRVLGTGQITPSDVRKAVFDVELRQPTTGARAGKVQMTASEPAGPP